MYMYIYMYVYMYSCTSASTSIHIHGQGHDDYRIGEKLGRKRASNYSAELVEALHNKLLKALALVTESKVLKHKKRFKAMVLSCFWARLWFYVWTYVDLMMSYIYYPSSETKGRRKDNIQCYTRPHIKRGNSFSCVDLDLETVHETRI